MRAARDDLNLTDPEDELNLDDAPMLEIEARADGDDSLPDEADDEENDDFRPSHRGIPTWSEAIGMIIDTNMEARARNPNPGPSSPRGRSRGNRGRGRN